MLEGKMVDADRCRDRATSRKGEAIDSVVFGHDP
jgi:hypothetical protein